jgi:glycosyltransferase involved in cell wall biosynthesis
MPVHNSEQFLKRSISSVIAQSYDEWELIICDDCSTDKSLDILRDFSKNPRIQIIQNENNLGPAKSRNKAIDRANGRYIAFLDSDDYWLKDKLKTQIGFMHFLF